MGTILIAYHLFPDIEVERAILKQVNAEVIWIDGFDSEHDRALVRNTDALMVALEKVSAELIESMERCRIVCRVGTGIDTIDIAAATQRNIWVTNVPDYSVDEVSSHAIAFLMMHARRLVPLLKVTQEGTWNGNSVRPIARLKGQTLGLVGLGRIGRAVAAKAQGLGLNVIAYDPYLADSTNSIDGVQLTDFETLLRSADFISLHVPLMEGTTAIINAKALALMKPTAFLINTARGPLIDEDALLLAIREQRIAGAALDVLATEPPASDHPLLHQERVFVTPHMGWYSEAANIDVRVRGAEDVVRVMRGEKPRTPVNQVASPPTVSL